MIVPRFVLPLGLLSFPRLEHHFVFGAVVRGVVRHFHQQSGGTLGLLNLTDSRMIQLNFSKKERVFDQSVGVRYCPVVDTRAGLLGEVFVHVERFGLFGSVAVGHDELEQFVVFHALVEGLVPMSRVRPVVCVRLWTAVFGHREVDGRYRVHPRVQTDADVVCAVPPLARAHQAFPDQPLLHEAQGTDAVGNQTHPLAVKGDGGQGTISVCKDE